MAKIDLDRGVLIRKHSGASMYVYMYIDTPGVYFNAHGNEVPEALAKAAGFDVETFGKERYKREKMQEFRGQLDRELEVATVKEKVIAKRDGYRVVARPLGTADVYDPDDQKLNDKPITEAEAMLLLDFMAPKPKAKGKGSGSSKSEESETEAPADVE